MAQEVTEDMTLAEPFKGRNLQSIEPASLLSMSKGDGGTPGIRLKGTDITLVPYYLAGSKTTGSRTYFALH